MTIDELKKILDDHKKWLEGSGGNRADLSGMDLTGTYLRLANLRLANLRRAIHREVDLSDADLSDAYLTGADLRDADLSGAYLTGADLRDADLSGANIDFSSWPLWCGSLDVKVDARIARQLAYHFCRLDCDDPEYLDARRALMDFANKFHRVDECGQIKEGKNESNKDQY